MTDRYLATGLLFGVIALGIVVASRGPAATERPEPSEDGFVELRFRLPNCAAPLPSIYGYVPQGSLVNTGNPMDLAIEGAGFFHVRMPNGDSCYTRDGAFRTNATGTLVISDGFVISPQITIPADAISISISTDGTVSVSNATGATVAVGGVTLCRFTNPAALRRTHGRLFEETGDSGPPTESTPGHNGAGLLRQGFLEQDRTHVVRSLIQQIQRLAETDEVAQRTKVFQIR